MSVFFEAVLGLLNSLLPELPQYENFYQLNEVLAYFITISVIWAFLLRPLLKLLRVVK